MNVENKGKYKVITPAAGMWLTDGESVSDSVFMPVGADESKWREITSAEKENIEAAQIEAMEQAQAEEPIIEEPIDIAGEIARLKEQLTDTDYKAIKYAEGWLTADEYAETKAQRQQWRDRINELESQL